MQAAKLGALTQEYVLPDFKTVQKGYIAQDKQQAAEQQTITLKTERFCVPEVLFTPSDIGIN